MDWVWARDVEEGRYYSYGRFTVRCRKNDAANEMLDIEFLLNGQPEHVRRDDYREFTCLFYPISPPTD